MDVSSSCECLVHIQTNPDIIVTKTDSVNCFPSVNINVKAIFIASYPPSIKKVDEVTRAVWIVCKTWKMYLITLYQFSG